MILATAPALAKPPLNPRDPPPDPPGTGIIEHSVPGQMPPPPSPRLPGVGAFQRIPSIDESEWVILATRKQPYWKAGVFDPVLSNACSMGDFATLPLNPMVVRFTDPQGPGMLRVVVPTHRHLLYDRRNLAKPTETYFFKDPGEASCQVWINGKAKPRALDPTRGTAVAKPDPKALAKKLKIIDGWPE